MLPEVQEVNFSLKKLFVPLTTTKVITIIVIIGFVVYANMLFNGFAWDDKPFILSNKEIHSINFDKIIGPSKFNATGYYRVIPALYFVLHIHYLGQFLFFYHNLQLIIHIVNAVLVFILFSSFFKKPISLFLSLIFLVHPIQVESVSYISSSGNPLFFLFGISALILSIKHTINRKTALLIAILLLLSLLSKETGLLFFVSILLYRWLFKRNSLGLLIITEVITLLLYFSIRFGIAAVYLTKHYTVSIAMLTFQERVFNIPNIIYYYIKTFFFPIQLATNQQWIVTDVNVRDFYFPSFIVLIFFLLIFSLGIFLYKYKRHLLNEYSFFLILFLLGLLLLLQLFPLDMTVADRWFYFPIVGLLGILGVALKTLNHQKKKIESFVVTSLIIILVALSLRTMVRNTDWKNNISLYSHDRLIYTNPSIEYDLASEYAFIQEYDKSIFHLHKSIEMYPCEDNLFSLGYIYELKGDVQLAKKYYIDAFHAKKCKRITHTHIISTYTRLGRILLLNDSPDDAKKYIKAGILDYPKSDVLWALLAVSEYKLVRHEALIYLRLKVPPEKWWTRHTKSRVLGTRW